MREIQPKVTRTSFGDVVVIRRDVNRLSLYKGASSGRTFGVATGQATYPTPIGSFTSSNGATRGGTRPTPWAKDAKPMPPGPGNPLGTRWMGMSAPGVGIHGTPDPASLGYSASHGCVRMLIPYAEWLFDQVEIGTPVYIVR